MALGMVNWAVVQQFTACWWIKFSACVNNNAVSLHGEVKFIPDEANVSRLKTDLVFNISDDDLEEWV